MAAHPDGPPGHATPYVPPAVPVRQPLMLHPHYEETLPEVHHWIRPYLLDHFGEDPSNAPRTDSALAQGHTYLGAACFPHTLPERFFAQQVWMIWSALVEDVFATPAVREDTAARIRLAGALCTAVDGAPSSGAALARLVRAGQDLMVPRSPAAARMDTRAKRLIAQRTLRPAAPHETCGAPTGLDSYLEGRAADPFGHWLTELLQWSLGIDLGELTDEDDDLRTACRRVLEHRILVDDLYSFPEEAPAGGTRDGVRVLMAAEDLTPRQALDRLAVRARGTEDAFVAARDAVLAGPLAGRPDVRAFVQELSHMVSGHLSHRHRHRAARAHGPRERAQLTSR